MPTSGLSDPTNDGNPQFSLPLIIGQPDYSSPGGTVGIQINSNVPNYFQYIISNESSTASAASSDYVIVADNGNDLTHYADFGMNNSGGGATPFVAANAAYFYSADNELDIGALGTIGVTNLYAGGGLSTPTQKVTMTAAGGVTAVGQTSIIGYLKSANMNITTDNTVPIVLPGGSTKYAVTSILVTNASVSLTTAAGGVYPAATKGGTPLVASGQAYSALTGATSLLSLTLAAAATNITYTAANLYLNLTTGQGTAATADVYVFGIPLF